MAADTIPSRLMEAAKVRPDRPAYQVRENGSWIPTTWKTYVAQVRQATRALIALGFEPGEATSILGFNRPEWVVMDLATMAAGGVPAGIYTTCSPEEVAYIVGHCEAKVVLVEDAGQWSKIEQKLGELPKLQHVITMKGAKVDHEMVLDWESFLKKGDSVDEAEVDARIEALEPEALATLIYTSGTTGPPKGVMLSHDNLSYSSGLVSEIVDLSEADCNLSYLPLSHIAEQMFSVHAPITFGQCVYFAESIEAVPDNLKEVQPTIFFGVPRIWEKFNAGISAKLKLATGVKKSLVEWAMGVGKRANAMTNEGKEPSGLLAVQYGLAQKLVFSKLKEAIGLGRARFCVSGAAPIAREVLEFFASLDIVVLEVYGQSEDTGPTSFNQPGRTRFGTVGPAVPGVEVKIADDGEIMVKGRNVFMGYYKDEAATNETLTDGWLHSGDLGSFDDQGFLCITGRKKEIIITAGGKNITPKNIEAALKNNELVNEAVVIGDRRKYLTALVTLDPETSETFAQAQGISGDLHSADAVRASIQATVDDANSKLARVETIKKFTVLPRNFTIEDGELTPTLKVKRNKVHAHFADAIEAMYDD